MLGGVGASDLMDNAMITSEYVEIVLYEFESIVDPKYSGIEVLD